MLNELTVRYFSTNATTTLCFIVKITPEYKNTQYQGKTTIIIDSNLDMELSVLYSIVHYYR